MLWALASWPAAIQGKGCTRLGFLGQAKVAAVREAAVLLAKCGPALQHTGMQWGHGVPAWPLKSSLHLGCTCRNVAMGRAGLVSSGSQVAQSSQPSWRAGGGLSAGSEAAPGRRPGTGSRVVGQAVGAEADQALAGVYAAASHAVCSEPQGSGRAPSGMEARIGPGGPRKHGTAT